MNSDSPVSSTLHKDAFNSISLYESFTSPNLSIYDDAASMQEQQSCYTLYPRPKETGFYGVLDKGFDEVWQLELVDEEYLIREVFKDV